MATNAWGFVGLEALGLGCGSRVLWGSGFRALGLVGLLRGFVKVCRMLNGGSKGLRAYRVWDLLWFRV